MNLVASSWLTSDYRPNIHTYTHTHTSVHTYKQAHKNTHVYKRTHKCANAH